jgi:aminopeptidase-like protein
VKRGAEMIELMRQLYPIPRSLTGDGVRQTLARLSQVVPLEITEVPTGTQVFDWTMPKEWNVDEAWIAGPDGNRVVDFADSSLHLLGYSVPVRDRLSLAELKERVFTHPDNPDWIPYRTSYYNENWAFCLSQRQLDSLPDGEYEVCVGTRLEDGFVTYGEALIPGRTADEFLLSTYICHPALCNDNLTGPALLAALAQRLSEQELRYTYRLLFSPATIGPLCWLSRNQDRVGRIKHGLVASCLGDPGGMTYKRSRQGDAEIDRAVEVVLRDRGREHTLLDWFPYGGDERQFNSPGFDLPVGTLSRSPADTFPGYHSSGDDFELVGAEWLEDSLDTYLAVIDVVERNGTFVNQSPYGEPQLGKRGLYRAVGGGSPQEAALLWTLSLTDGTYDLIGIAERSGLPFTGIREAADRLLEHDLLAPA